MTRKYHAHIPQAPASSDMYYTVRYDTQAHTFLFQTLTVDEARTLVHALNDCRSVEAKEITAPGRISDAEAVTSQAARIRDLISENVQLRRAIKSVTDLAALTSMLGESAQSVINARAAIAKAEGWS